MENGKLNGHGGAAEGEVDSTADGTKQAFCPLEQNEKEQAKSSVLDVFKKVMPQC